MNSIANASRPSRLFCNAVFGWTFTDYGDDYTAFEDGVISGGFHQTEQTTNGSNPLVVLYTKELAETRSRVIAAGGTISVDIFSFPAVEDFILPIRTAICWRYGVSRGD